MAGNISEFASKFALVLRSNVSVQDTAIGLFRDVNNIGSIYKDLSELVKQVGETHLLHPKNYRKIKLVSSNFGGRVVLTWSSENKDVAQLGTGRR